MTWGELLKQGQERLKKYLEENFPETYPAGYFEDQEKLA